MAENNRSTRKQTEAQERFSGDGAEGERGYRGNAAPDTPPGSVPGGSYGGGGGVSEGRMPDESASEGGSDDKAN